MTKVPTTMLRRTRLLTCQKMTFRHQRPLVKPDMRYYSVRLSNCTRIRLSDDLLPQDIHKALSARSCKQNAFGVKDFAFYDDALLVDDKHFAIPILKRIIESGIKVRFHTPNALHIREITEKNARLMVRAGFHTIRLDLETTAFLS